VNTPRFSNSSGSSWLTAAVTFAGSRGMRTAETISSSNSVSTSACITPNEQTLIGAINEIQETPRATTARRLFTLKGVMYFFIYGCSTNLNSAGRSIQ
jgi:hypothetical protein